MECRVYEFPFIHSTYLPNFLVMFPWEKQLKTLVTFNIMSKSMARSREKKKKVPDAVKCATNWIHISWPLISRAPLALQSCDSPRLGSPTIPYCPQWPFGGILPSSIPSLLLFPTNRITWWPCIQSLGEMLIGEFQSKNP